MLEEGLAVVHGLWTEPDGWGYAGRHWQVKDALSCHGHRRRHAGIRT